MRLTAPIVAVAMMALSLRSTSAQVDIINVDENGNGTAILGSSGSVPLLVTKSSPPVYHLGALLGFVPTAGDIVLSEFLGTGLVTSDLLRFDGNGDLTVFSDVSSAEHDPVSLADVGIPTFQSNVNVAPETDTSGSSRASAPDSGFENGLFNDAVPAGAAPGAGPAGSSVVIVYNFISDPGVVPEPASLSLLALAAPALLVRRRVRRHWR